MSDETYWTYKAASLTPSFEDAQACGAVSPSMTEDSWHQLSPGMRREIVRQHLRSLPYGGIAQHLGMGVYGPGLKQQPDGAMKWQPGGVYLTAE